MRRWGRKLGHASCVLVVYVSTFVIAPPSVADTSMPVSPILMTGFLRSKTSESIRPQAANEWSFNIMMLAPEGSRVQAGDKVAKFEGEGLKQRLSEATNALLQARVSNDQKIGELTTQIEDLRKQISDDERELALLQTSYTAAREAGEWAKAARDLLVDQLDIDAKNIRLGLKREKLRRKTNLLTIMQAAMAKNINVAELRVKKIQDDIASGERTATTSGVVVYKRTTRDRQKVRVGGSVHVGSDVLAIVDDKNLFIEAFLREEDWRWVKPGQSVRVRILGRRELTIAGEITRISAIVMKTGDWDRTLGEAHPLFHRRVFKVEIQLSEIPDEAKPDGEVEVEMAGDSIAGGKTD